MTPPAFEIRAARSDDVPAVHAMIGALAEYEKLAHLHVATPADLATSLFGPRPAAEVLIACKNGTPAAFALFFHNFSTFLGRRGLWLEDLFVYPAYRRQGCAKALLRTLAGIARDRGCGRFEWAVLDWNTSAIEFYETLGATVMPDWRIVRVVGSALDAMSAGDAEG
jgi:GNAT superfamily N-acetyltransferase